MLGSKCNIPESGVRKLLSRSEIVSREVRTVIYARVSSSDQRSDLERQIQYLTQHCSAEGYRVVDVLSDDARGLNVYLKRLA